MFCTFSTEQEARDYAERKGYVDLDFVETETGGHLTILDRMMQRRMLPVITPKAETVRPGGSSAGDAGTEDGQ